jgi:hypothetical protein
MTDLSRSDQLAETMAMMQIAREQGWGKVTIEITKAKVKMHVEADGDKVARPVFGTGRKA